MPSRSSAWRRRARDRSSAAGGARPGRSGPRSAPTVAAPAAHKPASRPDRILARTERSRVTVTVFLLGRFEPDRAARGRCFEGPTRGRARPSYPLQVRIHALSQRRTGCPGTGRPPACGMSRNEGRRCPGLVGRAAGRGGVVRAVRSFEDLAGRTNGPDRNADPAPSCREQTCVRTGREPGRPRREAGEPAPCPAGGAR